ncbi:MAG: hypothetical protein MJ201_03130 [Mycoplasmoidaceae bacterium]|nr:hypothetical protein [Mycoplasmoidaceae bacterium]
MNKFKLGSILVFSGVGATVVVPPIVVAAVESTLTPIHDKSVYFKTPAIADTITVIDLSRFDEDRKEDEEDLKDDMNTTFQSLEGLIVQQKQRAEIFVKSGVGQRDRWLYDMQDKYHFHINVISNVEHVDGQQDI